MDRSSTRRRVFWALALVTLIAFAAPPGLAFLFARAFAARVDCPEGTDPGFSTCGIAEAPYALLGLAVGFAIGLALCVGVLVSLPRLRRLLERRLTGRSRPGG